MILTVDESAEATIKKEGNKYFFNLRLQTHESEAKAMMERVSKAQSNVPAQGEDGASYAEGIRGIFLNETVARARYYDESLEGKLFHQLCTFALLAEDDERVVKRAGIGRRRVPPDWLGFAPRGRTGRMPCGGPQGPRDACALHLLGDAVRTERAVLEEREAFVDGQVVRRSHEGCGQ